MNSSIVLIVLITCGAWVLHSWVTANRSGGHIIDRLKESLGGDLDDLDGLMGDSRKAVSQIKALEKRIEVLERIVTDRKYDLNREIDKLHSA